MSDSDKGSYNPPWDYSFQISSTIKCVLCCHSGISVFVRGREDKGICESCAVIAHYMWRQAPGEVPPNYPESAKTDIARVYVAIARLAPDNEDEQGRHTKAQSMLPNSYEFVMVHREDDGTLDLPGVDVLPGESLREAAERALAAIKVKTWAHPDFVAPLYTAYTPRGRLATVMFVSAWGMVDEKAFDDGLEWRHAPLSTKATAMGGFYKALESVWAMRLYHHFSTSNHTEEICVKVSGMGSSYLELQRLLRSGVKNLDVSMSELMRRQMSDDEKKIGTMIASHAEMATTLSVEQSETAATSDDDEVTIQEPSYLSTGVKSKVAVADRQDSEETTEGGWADRPPVATEVFSGAEQEEDESSDEIPQDDEDEGEEVAVGQPEEGFVRVGRPLSMKDPE